MNRIRLNVTAEGQTEEGFVQEVLAPYLGERGVFAKARSVRTSKDKRTRKVYRGGLQNYLKARNDITQWMAEDKNPDVWFTTMFDLYALPHDFPGWSDAETLRNPCERVCRLEEALAEDIGDRRFIPYIQLHEFEALVLCAPDNLLLLHPDRHHEIELLKKVISGMPPESINDGNETAPSKRILKRIREYDKVLAGKEVTGAVGIDELRKQCPHFDEWITRLEALTCG